ncbi:MAG: nitroreductase [Desulfobaccales bacterium]
MEVRDALTTRRSIRAFLSTPVPREVILAILEAARWSPSWGNTQPWELAVVGGETWRRLAEALVERFARKVPPTPDVPMPETFPDEYRARYMACAAGLFGSMGIAREDKERRWAHLIHMTRAYGAPVVIFVLFRGDLPVPYTMFDLGAITHAIALAAHAQGLGTCIEAQLAHYPDLVREHLNLDPTHRLVVGIALGYPDPAAPANAFRTTREPLENFVRFIDL